ncbi:MAG: arsenate reductase ArsC [Gammaproteobacteria bacterium]|nr:arsenate reductase ArsC [Gammaproteobacteria bacterium]
MNVVDEPLNVLVLCTGNSCRSILAEALINGLGNGRLTGFSAGSDATGAINPNAIEILERQGFDVAGLRSKSWDQFHGDDAPAIDIVITVCDNAAGQSCPMWNGTPVTVHWGIPDPATATGDEVGPAFEKAFTDLKARIELMLELPLADFTPRMRQESLQRIHDALADRRP